MRTLTLVTKLLQNLTNKPTLEKEAYMAVLYPFLEENQDQVWRFFQNVCNSVDDFDTTDLNGPIQECITFSTNQLHYVHYLLEKHHVHVVSPSFSKSGDILHRLLSELSSPPFTSPSLLGQESQKVELFLGPHLITPPQDQEFLDCIVLCTLVANYLGVEKTRSLADCVHLFQRGCNDIEVHSYLRLKSLEYSDLVPFVGERDDKEFSTLVNMLIQDSTHSRDVLKRLIDSKIHPLQSRFNNLEMQCQAARESVIEYQTYLLNVRLQIGYKGSSHSKPVKQSLSKLEGVVCDCSLSLAQIKNTSVLFSHLEPLCFLIQVFYKGTFFSCRFN